MKTSAFHLGFHRDLVLTQLADQGLGARALRSRPTLEGASAAELIAGARALRAAGSLKAKPGLRLASGLLELGLPEEALEVLEDRRVDYAAGENARRLALARALAAAADHKAARAELERAEAAGAAAPGSASLTRALGSPVPVEDALALAAELCGLGLADLAARVLEPHLEAPPPDVLKGAFAVLRLCGPKAAHRLVQALERTFRQEGREASWRSTLTALDGGQDAGVEPEDEGSSARKLLLRACLAEACASARLWPAAIARFDFTGKRWPEPPDSLCELARCVGRDLLDRRPVALAPQDPAPPRIFDLFPYNGEARLLQLKLSEMQGWIERFILVEADETFTGRPKPLYYRSDPQTAAGALTDRITPVVAVKPPGHIAYTWAREFFQKDCGVFGLAGLGRPDDLVILSDADELLEREAAQGFKGEVAAAEMRTFRYFLNCEVVLPTPALKATVTQARLAAAHGWNYLRLGAIRYRRASRLRAAGWHFSSIGDAEWLAYKMQCTAHEEWAYQDETFFARFLTKMRKEGGLGAELAHREIDASFPASIRDSQDALADIIL